MKKRQLLGALVLFAFLANGYFLTAQQVGSKEQLHARVVDLGSKESAFELLKLYKDSARYMDNYLRYYAEIVINKNFNRPEQVIESIDSILTCYPEGGQTGYYLLRAFSLLEMGRYGEFATYCHTLQNDSMLSREPYFMELVSTARLIDTIPNYNVYIPNRESSVPIFSIDNMPLIGFSVTINGNNDQKMVLDTGAPFTLLSYETAKRCHVPLLGDTTTVISVFGEAMVRTGIVKELRVGEVVYQNVRVSVALEDVPDFFKRNNILGLRELQSLSAIQLSAGELTFKKNRQKDDLCPNMILKAGSLFAPISLDGGVEEFLIDTGADCNWVNADDSVPNNTVVHHSILGHSVPFIVEKSNRKVYFTRKNRGLLGLHFFRGFESFVLDMDRMSFSGKGYKAPPLSYTHYINSGDYAGLEANLPWYEKQSNEMDKWIIHTFLSFAKNSPKECIQYTDSLLTKYQDQLGESIISTINIRAAAFAFVGNYTSASQLLQDIIPSVPYLKGSYTKSVALAPIGGPQIDWLAPNTALAATLHHQGLLIEGPINKKKAGLYFAPNQAESTISSKDAATYGMKIVEYEEGDGVKKKIAIAQEVVLQDMVVRNMHFNVDEKADAISVGNNFLRLIPQFVLEKERVTLSSQSGSSSPRGVSYPLLMLNYVFSYYHQNGNRVESFSIGNPISNAQPVTLKELLDENSKITFDTRKMNIQFNK